MIQSETESKSVSSTTVSKFDKLSSDFDHLLSSEAYSDVILICGNGQKFRAHKAVLGSRSGFFSRMIEGEEEEMEEEVEDGEMMELPIGGLDIEIVQQFLRFLYTGKVDSLDQFAEKLLAVANDVSSAYFEILSCFTKIILFC